MRIKTAGEAFGCIVECDEAYQDVTVDFIVCIVLRCQRL